MAAEMQADLILHTKRHIFPSETETVRKLKVLFRQRNL